MFAARVTQDLAKQLGTTEISEAVIRELTTANAADIDEFRLGIEPLARAGKIGALLAQFPASFHDAPANRAHLATVLRAFGDYAIAVELRHRSWSEHGDETRTLLAAFGAAWAWIDEPKFEDSIEQPAIVPSPFAYVRFHGRHAASLASVAVGGVVEDGEATPGLGVLIDDGDCP